MQNLAKFVKELVDLIEQKEGKILEQIALYDELIKTVKNYTDYIKNNQQKI